MAREPNLWWFLTVHAEGIAILIIIALCFGFGTCGDGKGCHVRVGCGDVTVGPLFDGGVP